MSKTRRLSIVVAAIAVVCAGCSSSSGSSAPDLTSASSGSKTATAADVADSGGDFCSMYAAKVAQGLVGIRSATEGGAQVAEGIANDLANQASVSQSDLQAAAPPEPLGYLKAIDEADAASAEGDLSALDGVTSNLVLMNNWAKAHCDAKYRPVFDEYSGVIG